MTWPRSPLRCSRRRRRRARRPAATGSGESAGRLLEESWLEFDGISGTSAGAMNAAVMRTASPRVGARARVALEASWRRVARAATFSPFRRTPLDMALGRWSLDTSPAFVMLDLLAINPVERPGTPRRARQILNRLNEVSFNAVLLKQPRMMALLRDDGRRAADVFLTEHGDALGHRSSMDLDILLREV